MDRWISGTPDGYARRMSLYLSEMFPLPIRVVSSALLFTSFCSIMGRIHAVEYPILSWTTLTGSASVLLLMLTLRLMDELKDTTTDRALFPERALPSGKVLESDIRFSILVSVSLYISVNVFRPESLAAAVVLIGYAFLMFKWFFIPGIMRKNLLLALATHNPIVKLMLTYCVVMFAAAAGLPLASLHAGDTLLLILMYWSMAFAWEICRKIRSDREEDEYVTYSRLFGKSGAVLLAAAAQSVTLVIALSLSARLGFSALYDVIILAGYAVVMSGHVRFLLRPSPRTSKLRPWGELYMLSVLLAGFIEGIV